MKVAYSPEKVLEAVKSLDTRTATLSDDKLNNIIDDGYTELCSIIQAFSNEDVVSLKAFYENSEQRITVDVEEDVTGIYDLYLTEEGMDKYTFDYGVRKIRDVRVVYKDNRYNGRVHVDLDILKVTADNLVIKYYYVPTHTSKIVYMDAQTWLAFKSALGVALYDHIHDVERNGQKRAETVRRAKAIIPDLPEDANDPSYGRIFTGLEH